MDCQNMDWTTYLIMGVLVVLLVGFMLFSSFRNKKKNASTEEMKNNLRPGDKVQTIGGIIGIITEVNNAEGTITVSTGTSTMVFNRQAVYVFGFYDPPKPAPEQRQIEAENTELQSSEHIDKINADFLDAPQSETAESKSKATKKSKKSTGDNTKFE